MRLAQAGFGACLADDMGLGKTLQSLAVLLARSTGGAALVVAPTSVCGNWMAEAQRFAPGLHFVLYGESEREKLKCQQRKGRQRPWSMRKQLSIKEQLTSITVCSKHA